MAVVVGGKTRGFPDIKGAKRCGGGVAGDRKGRVRKGGLQVWLRVCEEGRETSRVVHDFISGTSFHRYFFSLLILEGREIIQRINTKQI